MENTTITLEERLAMIVEGVRPVDYQYVTDNRGVVHSSRESWLEAREAEDPRSK
ncbi:MAG: hypothetical protein HYT37_03245 [Candidatus Sungbacteria bacterium]|nr:hypothetical protein [Candidatus Sungbacteria bacterium]